MLLFHFFQSEILLDPDNFNRLVFSTFCLTVSVVLTYFWIISEEQAKNNRRDISGLVYLFIAYLLHAVIGYYSLFTTIDKTNGCDSIHVPISLLIISAFISFSFLSAMPFFSIGTNKADRLVSTINWKRGIKYFA